MIVFAIIGLIGITALAVDGGRAYLEKRNTQNVADSVAFDAALARIRGPQSDWAIHAYATAQSSGFGRDDPNHFVEIYSPPLTGKYKDDVEYIEVIVTSRVPAYFGKIFGINEMTVRSQTISRSKNSVLGPILNGNAVISLAPESDCDQNRAFWVHGESTLDIWGGGILINSNNPTCALMQNGNGSIRLEAGRDIKVVGGMDLGKPALISPPPQTHMAPISYPPPFMMPDFGCGKDAEIQPDGQTMSSGSWSDGTFPPPGVHYLSPGAYCLEGVDFHVKGGDKNFLEGQNVVFKVEGGRVHFDGGVQIDLRAPQQGDLAGLLIYVPMTTHFPLTINLGPEAFIRGTILAPGAEVRMNNDDSVTGLHSQIIGYTISSNGQTIVKIRYKDEDNYDAYTMPEVQLIQ